MAANLTGVVLLTLFVPAVWLALHVKDRLLSGTLHAHLRSEVRPGIRHYRYTVELIVPGAFADLPWRERGRRRHAFTRRGLRSLPSTTGANGRAGTSLAERRR